MNSAELLLFPLRLVTLDFPHAPIAQLDRAFDFESKGRRFEPCWVHQKP